MTDVFISYARPDRDEAQALATGLTNTGLTVWWDSELLSGEDFRAAILAKLHEAKAVVVIWSRDAIKSRWVCEEAEEAAHLLKMIAVGAPGFNPIDVPLGLRSFQVVPIANRAGIIAAITAAREGRLNAHNPLVRKTLLELWVERARRNAGVLAAGAAAVLALFIASMPLWQPAESSRLSTALSSWSPAEQKLIDLAARLDQEVKTATEHRSPPLEPDALASADATIKEIRKLDSNNGNAHYYSSLVDRWRKPADQLDEQAHEGYFLYLERVKDLPAAIAQTGPEQKYCYSRPWGYCTQRTAWIEHQLAYDYFRWAAKATGDARRLHLQRVLKYGRASLCLRPEGFAQGEDTAIMVAASERELGEPHEPCPK